MTLLWDVQVRDLDGTAAQARILSQTLRADHRLCLLFLEGDLGAGKTTFLRGFGAALGLTANINSPTFNLLNVYEHPDRGPTTCDLFHYDLYRLGDASELEQLDFLERWTTQPGDAEPARIHAIEWWQRAEALLRRLPVPQYRLRLTIPETAGETTPQANASAESDANFDPDELRQLRCERLEPS